MRSVFSGMEGKREEFVGRVKRIGIYKVGDSARASALVKDVRQTGGQAQAQHIWVGGWQEPVRDGDIIQFTAQVYRYAKADPQAKRRGDFAKRLIDWGLRHPQDVKVVGKAY